MDFNEPETHGGSEFDADAWSVETNRIALIQFRQDFPDGNLQWTIGLDFEKTQELGWFALNVQYLKESIEQLIQSLSVQDQNPIPTQRLTLLDRCLDSSNAVWKLVEEFVNQGHDSEAIRNAVVEHQHLLRQILADK